MEIQNFNSSNSDPFLRLPLVECSILTNIGIYCVILFILSMILNITLIWILIKNRKKLLDSTNALILSLSILSLLGTLVELPMVSVTSFACR